VSIEINLKQAIVKLSNPTEEIRMLCEPSQRMKITKCRQDRQGRVFITVEFENRRTLQSAKKKSVKRRRTKQKTAKSRKTNVRARKTRPKKTGFNKLLGEIL
jgi:hypothetical protein